MLFVIFLLQGCASQPQQSYLTVEAENDIFTKEMFQNLAGVEDVMQKKEISDDENLQIICNALASEELTEDTKENEKTIYGGRIYNLIYKNGTKKEFVLSSNDREELTLEYEGLRYVSSEKMHETISECFEK